MNNRYNTEIVAETERLILRHYEKTDFRCFFEYISDEEVVKFEPHKPMSPIEAEKELDRRIENPEMIAVELKSEKRLIGNVYLGKRDFCSLEIGYVFNKSYWRRGYAKESCEALIKKAFSEGAHRIYAECDPLNTNSWKLLESMGFAREAHFKQNVYFWTDENGKPIWKDTFVYALTAEE